MYVYVYWMLLLRLYHLRFLYGIKTSFELPTTTKAIITITHNLYNHSFMYCIVYVHKNASGIQHTYPSVVDEKIKLPRLNIESRSVQSCNVYIKTKPPIRQESKNKKMKENQSIHICMLRQHSVQEKKNQVPMLPINFYKTWPRFSLVLTLAL